MSRPPLQADEPVVVLHRMIAALVVAGGIVGAMLGLPQRARPAPSRAWVPVGGSMATPALAPAVTPAATPAPSRPAQDAGAVGRWLALGDAAFDAGDFGRAERAYGQALGLEPNTVAAWVGRGNARARLGRLDGALADLEQAQGRLGRDDPRRPLVQADLWAARELRFPTERGVAVSAVVSQAVVAQITSGR